MKKLLCTVALVGMLVAPGVVQAQTQAGAILAYHDDLEAIGVGAGLSIGVPQLAPGFAVVPNFVWFFPDAIDFFEVNGDLMYTFPVSADSPVAPFAFGGLTIGRASAGGFSNTEVGLNLGGGVNFNAGSLNPFAGAKIELQDGSSFVIFGGIAFPLGGA